MTENKQPQDKPQVTPIRGKTAQTYMRVQLEVEHIYEIRTIDLDGSARISLYRVTHVGRRFARLESLDGYVLEVRI